MLCVLFMSLLLFLFLIVSAAAFRIFSLIASVFVCPLVCVVEFVIVSVSLSNVYVEGSSIMF